MAKHTEGPWEIADDGTIQHESGMLICTMSSSEDFPCIVGDESKSEAEERAEVDAECAANARIIAAAPDLLEAVKDALAIIETPVSSSPKNLLARVQTIRAVITKAEAATPAIRAAENEERG